MHVPVFNYWYISELGSSLFISCHLGKNEVVTPFPNNPTK